MLIRTESKKKVLLDVVSIDLLQKQLRIRTEGNYRNQMQ